MKYSGSKLKLLPYILSVVRFLPVRQVFDGFSGTTRVSQALAKSGYQVIANDRAVWSKVFGHCYLKGKKSLKLQDKINYLNNLKGVSDWFTEHYGGTPKGNLSVGYDGKKRLWQTFNTKKLDAIRPEIDKISENSIEKSILLTSLILALDKVDNTLGHYASYLREWSPRSFNKIQLLMPLLDIKTKGHKVISRDIFQALPNIKSDLSYFDPPYGSNNIKMPASRVRYASYYHIWKTVCLNDKPELTGQSNRRIDCNDKNSGSIFEEFRKNKEEKFIALTAIDRLIKESLSKYILFSYSSEGRVSKEEICEVINKQCKKAQIFSIDYKRNVMSSMRWTFKWTKGYLDNPTEFLFLIEK
ncbi:MAG: DNA adenine methylase [Bdellovibrionaceae bacterium]|nr:DNA adenine methylase [Pseudobdellovibrionaceae bacterium]